MKHKVTKVSFVILLLILVVLCYVAGYHIGTEIGNDMWQYTTVTNI